MYKLVVLFALLAVASAGLIHGGDFGLGAYAVAPAIAIPSAVSHQSRTDVFSKPVIATYSSPIVASYAAAPVAYSVPVVKTIAPAIAIPTAVSHQSRTDVFSKPVIATYAAPVATYVAAPAWGGIGIGHGYGHGYY